MVEKHGEIEDDEEQYDVILEDVETGIRPRAIKSVLTKKKSRGSGWQYASLAGEIGFDIALPMVLGAVVGNKLDLEWGTRPKAALVLFLVGVVISCTSLMRIVRDVLNKR